MLKGRDPLHGPGLLADRVNAGGLERFGCCEGPRRADAVAQTCKGRLYGNRIQRKGVIPAG